MQLVLIVTLLGIFACPVKADWRSKVVSTREKLVSTHAEMRTRMLQASMTINKAEVGSKTFALEDSYDCDNDMVAIMRKFFKANDATFDMCMSNSGYHIYPYTGILPDSKAMIGLVNSNACMGIVTAVVLLDMPPCIIDKVAMRAACETILNYSVAMSKGVEAPTAEQFNEVMMWRRDVDLARAAHKPFDGKSEAYAEFTNNVREALGSTKVVVLKNYTVILDPDSIEINSGNQPWFVSTNSSMDYFVGRVVAAENAINDAPVMAASKIVTTTQSSNSVTAASTTFAMTLVLAAAFVSTTDV